MAQLDLLPQVSLQAPIKVTAKAGVSSQGVAVESCASTLTQVVVGRIWFLMDCWADALSLSPSVDWRPPSVPCHMGLSTGQFTTWQLASSVQVSKTEHPCWRPRSYYVCQRLFISSDIPSPLLFSGRGELVSPSCITGEGITQQISGAMPGTARHREKEANTRRAGGTTGRGWGFRTQMFEGRSPWG